MYSVRFFLTNKLVVGEVFDIPRHRQSIADGSGFRLPPAKVGEQKEPKHLTDCSQQHFHCQYFAISFLQTEKDVPIRKKHGNYNTPLNCETAAHCLECQL